MQSASSDYGAAPHPAGVRRGRAGPGFTLVEVLCAAALLSIGLMAVLSASQASRETQRRAYYIAIGRTIAQSKIDELRATAFDSLPTKMGMSTSTSLPRGNAIKVSVNPYSGAADGNVYQACVVVAWPEGRGTRTIRYDTLIARK